MAGKDSDIDNSTAICVMKEIVGNLSKTTDNLERANLLRQSAMIMYHENINKDEDLANYILDDVLKSYRKVVTTAGEGTVNNYTDQVVELLKKSRRPIDRSKGTIAITLDDVVSDKLNCPCKGEYRECKHQEVNDEDLKALSRLLKEDSPKRKLPMSEQKIIGQSISEGIAEENGYQNLILNTPMLSSRNLESKPSSIEGNNPFFSKISVPESNPPTANDSTVRMFKTAREEFIIQKNQRYSNRAYPSSSTLKNHEITGSSNYAKMAAPQQYEMDQECNQLQRVKFSYGAPKKSLGVRRTVPVRHAVDETSTFGISDHRQQPADESEDVILDERLKHIDPKMVELISSEIMSKFKPVDWDDIAGLEYAKTTIQEAVIWPMLRPDIFTGLRRPPRGILLFGPPGTGKTLIGKCIASQSNSTFFSISASSLTSKWIGDGEKMVRALFAVAAVHQPSVIFIDEVDSLLCQRSETEHESSRRIKTEFLVQLDGAVTSDDDRILIIGATNRPQELDEAARRRFTRRLYIPLPEQEARLQILKKLLGSVRHSFTDSDIVRVSKLSSGYSGADMESLCREASMEPIRSIPPSQILNFDEKEVRPVEFEDFRKALNRIRASVSQSDLQLYVRWNETYGSGASR